MIQAELNGFTQQMAPHMEHLLSTHWDGSPGATLTAGTQGPSPLPTRAEPPKESEPGPRQNQTQGQNASRENPLFILLF